MQLIAEPIGAAAEIEPALTRFARQPNTGLMMPGDSFTRLHQTLIADLAGRYRLPSIAGTSDFAKDSGLMDYSPFVGVDRQYGQAATYIDRILKGAKPDDLPVQAPTQYRLVINLKTAKTLGLAVPLALLTRADEVIE